MNVLEAVHLQKIYRDRQKTVAAVQEVSLTLAAKEVLAFLGPNGAGKTTTIKMIAGLILPDRGSVRIVGRDPHRDPKALRSVGAVLEGNRNVYWRLTPEENLEYFGVLRGLTRKVARQRAQTLLERFDLTDKRHSQVQKLSRGMQQKLAIAVSLIHDPQLLLLDEPTLGLDVEATASVKQLVREIAAEGRAILLTTHQLDIAEELSDRVAIISQGKIVIEEPTSELIRQFSGTAYRIELELPLDDDRTQKIGALGAVVEGDRILVEDITLLYPILDILKPLPLVRLEKDRTNLTEIFLKLVGSNALGSSTLGTNP
ncbi:MAG: ABC transporter ATP-binding protein [Drouetiella hepatica Uher 2000/2452]|jgi:ABC-2 type transport system ATP-binding protein|uniref:ABC transporter ATP-binding protein n=1 Tax=Drouetiella hepatica Uher 2000/2452 TaxID=904376 RepID=A0A951Q768_9CYAN|nr:ABC transporter ATP-binding protein [Drouetiella hepatica Uher 2000/2452]